MPYKLSRGRNSPSFNKRFQHNDNTNSKPSSWNQNKSSSTLVECQICRKQGHSAFKCWYRTDLSYKPSHKAFFTGPNLDWILDSAATSYLTQDIEQLQHPKQYYGSQQVSIANGGFLPIHNTGQGIFPTANRKLHLNSLLHTPHLS